MIGKCEICGKIDVLTYNFWFDEETKKFSDEQKNICDDCKKKNQAEWISNSYKVQFGEDWH